MYKHATSFYNKWGNTPESQYAEENCIDDRDYMWCPPWIYLLLYKKVMQRIKWYSIHYETHQIMQDRVKQAQKVYGTTGDESKLYWQAKHKADLYSERMRGVDVLGSDVYN